MEPRLRATARSSSRLIMLTAWGCLTRVTTALCWWTSGSTVSDDRKFRGAATAIDGKIIFAPCIAIDAGVFDLGQRPFSCNMAHISTNSIYNELTPSNLLVRGSLTRVRISSTISHDWKFSLSRDCERREDHSRLIMLTAWGCLTRVTTALCWWTSPRPSLTTRNSAEPRLRATARSSWCLIDADGVGVFDPSDNSFVLVDLGWTMTHYSKFSGAATACDGKIIFAPYKADGVGVFDPSDNSFVLVDISSTISDDWKFRGAATAIDGKIIFAPCNADGVGVFDPEDNSFVLVT